MPPLSHYPDRHEPFDPARSQVYAYLLRECHQELRWGGPGGKGGGGLGDGEDLNAGDYRVLGRIHSAAKSCGVIRFDPETRLWRGMAPPWQRYLNPSEREVRHQRHQREARERSSRICVCERCGEWFDGEEALERHFEDEHVIEWELYF